MAEEIPTRLTAARAAFIGIFGLALGWAGVAVAAIAVAIERAKNGDDIVDAPLGSGGWWDRHRAAVRQRRAERQLRDRQWLEQDAERNRKLREARQRWVAGGGDPATEPKKPGYAVRVGRGARRNYARTRLGIAKVRRFAGRIMRDLKDGWQAAAPNAQYGFRAAARTRPDQPAPAADGQVVDAQVVEDRRPTAPDPDVIDTKTRLACTRCGRGVIGPDGNCNRCLRPFDRGLSEQQPAGQPAASNQNPPDEAQASGGDAGPATAGPAEETGTGDEEMALPKTADEVRANTNPQAVDGDDHLDRITAGLGQMAGTLARADEQTDSLMSLARQLRAQAAAVMERAGDKATTATRQACDEALRLAQQIEELVDQLLAASAACAESIGAADLGLNPARESRDGLHTAGATGDLLATASDG